ncbi:MAG: rhomboid family intramembrane serine protease [Pseudomonadota bacterium]
MSDDMHQTREPIFNLPGVVTALVALLALIHLGRSFLPITADVVVLGEFAFVPAFIRDMASGAYGDLVIPGGFWTFVTYAFLHGDWMHLIVNSLWIVAFGPAIYWRFGFTRFALFSLIGAVAGAAVYFVNHSNELVPMVGASAVVSAYMAAALRFAFQDGAPLGYGARKDASAYRMPANSLTEAFSNRTVLGFIAVYLAINLLFGVGAFEGAGGQGRVAWEAHLGGFAAGLFLFPLFDPISNRQV